MAGRDGHASLPREFGKEEPHVADAGETAQKHCRREAKLVSELSNAELLASILGPSTAALCRSLMTAYPNLRNMALLNPAIFADHGFTTDTVHRIEAAFELAKRYGETEWGEGEPFRGAADVYAHFRERLATEMCELFYAVLLDNKHRKIRDVLISKGSLTSSIVHPRDLFAQVVRHSAAAVVLVHNHPSGVSDPSREDIQITRRLREVGDLLGVRVLDHIIVGKGNYVSFVDHGFW